MLDMLTVRPKVVAVRPWLNHVIVLEEINGFGSPILAPEVNVGINCRDVFGLWRKTRDADVESAFLVPNDRAAIGTDYGVIHTLIGHLWFAVTEDYLNRSQIDAAVQHVLFEALIERQAALPSDRIGQDSNNVEKVTSHSIFPGRRFT